MNSRHAFDEISFNLLKELTKEPVVTQRALAARLNIALGLVNAYVKRLYKKGYIKIKTLPENRIKYIITPKGFAEKARLTYGYMHRSINYFRDVRQKVENIYAGMVASGVKEILIWGDGEVAELCYISTRGLPLKIVGVVGDKRIENGFFGHHIYSIECVKDVAYDAILVSLIGDKAVKSLSQAGINPDRIYYL
ncbi:MAG TPA: winged helix-turn-helix transcriptional regulator, partial [Thermodesulfovibrionia bacterium]|nr:winged helix-turn-helix transcriptional regulator [Thermodesulfovibrionia bacterium]